MVVPSKPPKKILRRRKVHINPRIKMEQLRRVWAARNFEPKEGWPGGKYVWTLEYDMFEHVDNPPKGESHGFRNYKVCADPVLILVVIIATDWSRALN